MGQCADGRAVVAGSWALGSLLSSHTLREIPRGSSAVFPTGIQLPPHGSSQHGAVAIGQQRKYNIASIKCCHPTPWSEPVILHVQSRQPVSRSCSSEPLARQSQGSWSTKWPDHFCMLVVLKECGDCSDSDTDWSHLWADLTHAGCQAPGLDWVS